MSSPETTAGAAPDVHCAQCGTVLPPNHGVAPCPQCHAPTWLALHSPARVDPGGTICCDVVCRQCGYNLRGLRPEGLCPECATPIAVAPSGAMRAVSAEPAPPSIRRVLRGPAPAATLVAPPPSFDCSPWSIEPGSDGSCNEVHRVIPGCRTDFVRRINGPCPPLKQ